jgi:DNA recombination protein RmuC
VEISWLVTVFGIGLALLAVLLAVLLMKIGALTRAGEQHDALKSRLETIGAQNERLERELRVELAQARTESAQNAKTAREELAGNLGQFAQTLQHQLSTLTQSNEQRLEAVRATVEQRLDLLRTDNTQKLEQMRATVDEKLHATLEHRLGESFKLVSDRLEQVHKGLGEMQSLATGVGDLKRVLTNVKSRGGWGEVQLGALLEEFLSAGQYAKNVATRPGSAERVEYAIRFPGRGEDGTPCWLPIDAKFPLEDYQRLQDAIERADVAAVDLSRRALEDFFKAEARKIRDKYIEPPHTTDFAILFIPTEGLYAEALARPGLADSLQRDCRVMLAGPSNLHAFLNSLQLGFRTLAIEQRSSEVWKRLAAVKTEFARFGEVLAATKKKLEQASDSIGSAEVRTRAIERQLRDVEALPQAETDRLLAGDPGAIYDPDDEAEPASGDAG